MCPPRTDRLAGGTRMSRIDARSIERTGPPAWPAVARRALLAPDPSSLISPPHRAAGRHARAATWPPSIISSFGINLDANWASRRDGIAGYASRAACAAVSPRRSGWPGQPAGRASAGQATRPSAPPMRRVGEHPAIRQQVVDPAGRMRAHPVEHIPQGTGKWGGGNDIRDKGCFVSATSRTVRRMLCNWEALESISQSISVGTPATRPAPAG